MNEEKIKILEMVQNGRISAVEGLELINALGQSETSVENFPSKKYSNRFFKVRVDGDKAKVNVNIPLNLIKATSKFIGVSMNYIPQEAKDEMCKKGFDLSQLNIDEIIRIVDEELVEGKIVDVDVVDPNEGRIKVEVYVE